MGAPRSHASSSCESAPAGLHVGQQLAWQLMNMQLRMGSPRLEKRVAPLAQPLSDHTINSTPGYVNLPVQNF